MNSIPSALASRGERISSCSPLMRIEPESREIAPPNIFMSVDFPAPFSPIRASTSALLTRIVTWSRATTPGNLLEIPSISRIGVLVAIRLTTATKRVDLLNEFLYLFLLNRNSRNKYLFARRNHRLVSIEYFCEQLHRTIAEFERLLNDSRIDCSIFNAA